MAEQVGSIVYTVSTDTSDMIRAEAQVNKSIKGMTAQFSIADRAVRQFSESQRDLGRQINAMGQVIDKNGKVVASATIEYRKLAAAASESFSVVDSKINGVASAINRNFTHNIQNASFQIQDFAVQVGSGQSAMVAFVQQLPQLVGGLGLLGAGIATAVAVFGGMYLVLGDTKTNIEKLEKAIEGVQAAITLGAGGIQNYTEEMKKLSRVSETLARIKLAQTISETSKVIKLSTATIKDSFDEFIGGSRQGLLFFRREVEKFAENVDGDMSRVAEALDGRSLLSRGGQFSTTLERLKKDFGITTDQAVRLGLAYSDLANKQDAVSATALSNTLQDIAKESGFSNSKINELTASLTDYFVKISSSVDATNQMRQALQGNTKEIIESSGAATETNDSFDRLNTSLNAQLIELQQGARAAFQYKLANSELTPEQQAAALATYDRVEAQRQLNKETQDFLASNERALEQEKRKKEMQRNTLERQVQGIGLTPLQEIEQRYAQELELLRQAEEQGIQIRGTYAERQKQIEAEKTDAIKRLNEGGVSFLSNVFSNFEQQSAAALTSVVTGAQSGSDALKGLARTILTSVIQAIIQQGIASATAAATAATAQSAANATIAATAAPAAAAVSLATSGANAPLATAGISSTVGVAAALFGATALAGARQFGGPVTSGKSYLVGERGPEIFTPNGSGSITSNKDSFGGGGVTVNVNNYASNDLSFDVSKQGEIIEIAVRRSVDAVAGQINSGQGKVPNAMRQSGTFRTDARRGR